ncbi:hypothetical protein COHA_006636 [Chlorella ohadii]|uniref:F-box domain-containing protein n=1 Tax=Chlorella ohadii TaxID=2649997 RepID=A0AAD5DL37_9CHLO|nr:hypothetical protein COHA_006636 [Chlorella ohadii]
MPNAKRKSPQAGGAAEPPAPLLPAGPRPTSSSPALGWGLRSQEGDSCDATCDSARETKALRICTASAAEPAQQAAALEAPAGCGAGGMHAVCSVPLAMLHSYHAGCCSRLGSSSSLSELDAAGSCGDLAAAAAGDECPGGLPAAKACSTQQQAQQQQQQQQSAGCCDSAGIGMPIAAAAAEDAAAAAASAAAEGRAAVAAAAAAAAPWADPPDDILKRVLDQLQPSTLRVLRLVCRGWEAAASRLLVHLRPEGIAGKQLASRFPSLHSLDLSNCCMGVDFTTPRMLRLQSLLCNEHLAELAGLGRLEQLSLRGCSRLTGAGLAQLGCLRRSLTMLNLSNCTGLTDDCLAALAAALPQLATLNLQGCSGLGDEAISHLVNMPNLRRAAEGRMWRPGLKRVVLSKCPQINLESSGGPHLKVVTDPSGGAAAAAASAADAALVVALAGPAGMAGQDMQLLVGAV